jgi:CRISPR/Cas system-associated exonuclease Cas4 (RecB family)
MRPRMQQRDIVRVSEIADYMFCRRSWYVSATGVRRNPAQIERMREGILRHRRHGRLVSFSRGVTNAAMYFLIFALVLAALWLWTNIR